MPRKKPKPVKKPFFTPQPDIAKRLESMTEDERRVLVRGAERHEVRQCACGHIYDWVDEADDELIGSRPHLQEMVNCGLRLKMDLSRERIHAKRREGTLSREDFRKRILSGGIVAELEDAGAWSEDDADGAFCDADLYVLYLNYRWTPADEILVREFANAEGRDRMRRIMDTMKSLAVDLRWLVAIAEALPPNDGFEMTDEIWHLLNRAAGGKRHRGWLSGLADTWLNEAADRMQRPAGQKKKDHETAFMIEWHRVAVERTGEPQWGAGRRLFLEIFGSAGGREGHLRYRLTADYKRAVEKKLPNYRLTTSLQ